jgi:transposase-like protein
MRRSVSTQSGERKNAQPLSNMGTSSMSKIPQGEWNAIAARYAQGESISRIAQSYGCTPPAIHYILKRHKQRAAPDLGPPQVTMRQAAQTPLRPEAVTPPRLREEERSIARPIAAESATATTPPCGAQPGRERQREPFKSEQIERGRPPFLRHQPQHPRQRGAAGLDSELHGRAEAAIAAFRSSFDAALAESSPLVRQQLRQAAADLMRVAARTTIVLDQLNARAERQASGRLPG